MVSRSRPIPGFCRFSRHVSSSKDWTRSYPSFLKKYPPSQNWIFCDENFPMQILNNFQNFWHVLNPYLIYLPPFQI